MAKYPVVGDVKTRIGKELGFLEATRLYVCFLKDTVEKVKHLNTPFFIYFTPDNMEEDFKQLLGFDLKYVPQRGRDLGERLHNGFKISSIMGYPAALALASDVPDLPSSILRNALKGLENYDSVLGPSPDGGYYLIGLKYESVKWELFHGINWSTDAVFRETRSVIKKLGISLNLLEIWNDVDQVKDLQRLADSKNTDFRKTQTWRYLKFNDTV